MKFKEYFKESIDIEAYHGTLHDIKRFSDEFVGEGVDQEGPGIYFTTNDEDAYGYARKSEGNGKVFHVMLRMNKIIKESGKVKESEIDYMIKGCEDLENKMMNWGSEDLNENIRLFKASLRRDKGPKDVFLSIWYNLYRYNPKDYVRNMVSLGYDGLIVQKEFMNTKHIIVYNPKIINVLDIF